MVKRALYAANLGGVAVDCPPWVVGSYKDVPIGRLRQGCPWFNGHATKNAPLAHSGKPLQVGKHLAVGKML